jgi:CRP-like cAMP-binding protein
VSIDNPEMSKVLSRFKHSSLPEEFLVDLASDSLNVKFAKNARLFLQGTPADNLMLVATGAVKIYCPQSSGRGVMVGLAGPGEVIGYADFIDSKGRFREAFEAQALTNCSVALISRQRIEKGLGRLDPGRLVGLMESANGFWTAFAYRCVSLMGMTFRERLEAVIGEIAEKFGVTDARGTLLTLELGHDDWAALIASSRSLASKLLSEMIDRGILEREGRRYTILKDGHFKRNQLFLSERSYRNGAENGTVSAPNVKNQTNRTGLSPAAPSHLPARSGSHRPVPRQAH